MSDPVSFRVPAATEYSGISRAELYRLAAAGRLIFRKSGRTTLVDGDSLRALVKGLPQAEIKVAVAAQTA